MPLIRFLFDVPPEETRLFVAGRAAVYLLLLVVACRLVPASIESNRVGESFLHLVNLPFHEAGHVIFGLVGNRFLSVLGGSLMQWLMPLAVLCAFLSKRDLFGASVGLWWLGESFLDSAPYINDARAGQLLLLGGVTGSEVEDYHDWEVILRHLGWLRHDHALAGASHALGALLIVLALAYGAYVLWRQARPPA
ncbi:MAG TPA: hypothetical protein VIU29_10320 [Candidatus Deferrimicrobiaceae bacterium]